MSQYQTGTVTVTANSAAVLGAGTAFLANVAVGNIFTVQGENVWYEVAGISDDTHLTLSANYTSGSSGAGKAYVISSSFTPNIGVPYIEQGDIETASIFKRAMLVLEGVISSKLSKSVAGNQSVTLTAAEARNRTLIFTGLLTGNISVVVPTKDREWVIFNNTTGAFSVTVKTAVGTGIVIAQTKRAIVQGDAVNVVRITADV